MSRSLSRLQAIILGLAVLTGLVLATFGLFAVGSRQWLWTDTFHVQVGFRQIRGVEPGTRVRVLGRDAGEVEEVIPPDKPSGVVKLRLRIDGRLRRLIRADASAQIAAEGMVGGKVIDIHPGSDNAPPIQDNAEIAAQPSADLTDVLAQVSTAFQGIRQGEGALGKLVKDDEAYDELVQMLRQGKGTMASLKKNSDALQDLPVIRNYVQDASRELIRPDCSRNRKVFPESDLFEPGHAVLTAGGRQRLDELAPWLEGLKHRGSSVVVVSYGQLGQDPDPARILTQKQSEAVCQYLTGNHDVQKMGWFSKRKVTALGCGIDAPPEPEKDALPRPRLEVVVFVPQG